MNVLICNERFLFRFGLDRVLILLAKGLKERGHGVTIMGNRYDEPVVKAVADRIIDVPSDEAEYRNLNEYTAQWFESSWAGHFDAGTQPGIAVIGGWPFFAAIPFFRRMGVEVLFVDCGAVPLDGYKGEALAVQQKVRHLRQAYMPQASRVIAISDFIALSQTMDDCNREVPIDVVLLGADHMKTSLWTSGAVGKGGAGGAADLVGDLKRRGSRVILSLGRWETNCYKNVEALFEIMEKIGRSIPDSSLLVLADPEQVDIPRRLRNNIFPIGFPDDLELAQIMEQIDLAVCTSLWEGFNLPVAEVQWAGKPALAFSVGAHPEVIMHPWFLCRDNGEMVAKACEILSEKGFSGPALDVAREEFVAFFRWERVVGDYVAILGEVDEGRRSLPPSYTGGDGSAPVVVVDVTNAAADPANSGVVRVTRRLCRELQKHLDPWFVVREPSTGRYVLPTRAQYDQLGRFNGPELRDRTRVASGGKGGDLFSLFAVSPSRPCWLLMTELVPEGEAAGLRRMARGSGMHIGAIFYDAIPVLHPELVKDETIRQNHSAYMKGLAECDVVVPISDFSSQCLEDFWRAQGVSGPGPVPDQLPGEFGGFPRNRRAAFAPPDEVKILCVSTLEPRKNHMRLVGACVRLQEAHPELAWSLTLVGNRYAGAFEIAEEIESIAKKNPRIGWLGVVDDDRLHGLYKAATFTVYPSVIEGFGMPILESIWHGKPCICYDQGVMAELASGGGCLTTDVTDEGCLADAVYALATDGALLRKLGEEAVRSRIRTWNDYVHDFLNILDSVAKAQGKAAAPAGHRPPGVDAQPLSAGAALSTERGAVSAAPEEEALRVFLFRYRPRRCLYLGPPGEYVQLLSAYSPSVVALTGCAGSDGGAPPSDGLSHQAGPSPEEWAAHLAALEREGGIDLIVLKDSQGDEDWRLYLEAFIGLVPKHPFFLVVGGDPGLPWRRTFDEVRWEESPYVDFVEPDFSCAVGYGGEGKDDDLAMVYFRPSARRHDTVRRGEEGS